MISVFSIPLLLSLQYAAATVNVEALSDGLAGASEQVTENNQNDGEITTNSNPLTGNTTQATRIETWSKTFGGQDLDSTRTIQNTTDGGYIVAGWSKSFGKNSDVWLLKLDSEANVQWQKTLVAKGFEMVESKGLRTTMDGGYIVAGQTDSAGAGKADIWVVKLDGDGEIEWQNAYGGPNVDRSRAVQQTRDGGYIVSGMTNSFGEGARDFWVLKLDPDGNIEWQKTYGGKDFDVSRAIELTSDGGYIVAGWSKSFGVRWGDYWIIKLDIDGKIQWEKSYGGEGFEEPAEIKITPDGGYIVIEETWSFGTTPVNGSDAWVTKLDSNGTVEWEKTYGAKGFEEFSSLHILPNNSGYIIAGQTNSFGAGQNDTWVAKLDYGGDLVWQKTFGGRYDDESEALIPSPDGGYILAGRTNSTGAGGHDIWLLKIDSTGGLPDCSNTSSVDETDFPLEKIIEADITTLTNSTAVVAETNAVTANSTAVVTSTSAIATETRAEETEC
jgi:hypothetical protein